MVNQEDAQKINLWVDKYMVSTIDGDIWGFLDPTHGDPTPVIELLDSLWPQWRSGCACDACWNWENEKPKTKTSK